MSEKYDRVEENLGRALNDLYDVLGEYENKGPDNVILMRLQGTLIRVLYWANRLRLRNWARRREEESEEEEEENGKRSRRKRRRKKR